MIEYSLMDAELDQLERALRDLHRRLSSTRRWEIIAAGAGVYLDRTSAIILSTVAYHAELNHMQAIADKLGMEPAVVTRKLQLLETQGYITKQVSDSDKRIAELSITPDGQVIADELTAAKRKFLQQTVKDWSAQEVADFARLLQKFGHSAQQFTDS